MLPCQSGSMVDYLNICIDVGNFEALDKKCFTVITSSDAVHYQHAYPFMYALKDRYHGDEVKLSDMKKSLKHYYDAELFRHINATTLPGTGILDTPITYINLLQTVLYYGDDENIVFYANE